MAGDVVIGYAWPWRSGRLMVQSPPGPKSGVSTVCRRCVDGVSNNGVVNLSSPYKSYFCHGIRISHIGRGSALLKRGPSSEQDLLQSLV